MILNNKKLIKGVCLNEELPMEDKNQKNLRKNKINTYISISFINSNK